MRKFLLLPTLFFFFIHFGFGQATTYNLSFANEEISGTTFCVDLVLSFNDVGSLGSSNIVLSYSSGLDNPSYFSDNITDPPFYFVPTVSNPVAGIASFNIELAVEGFGDAIAVFPTETVLGRICFDVVDDALPIDLAFLEDAFTQTIIFLDDEVTNLTPGTLTPINVPCAKTGNPCDDGDICTINDVWDADCNCVGTPELPDAFVTSSIEDAGCGFPNGSITFNFAPVPGRTAVQFSLDGGTTFEAEVPLADNTVTYDNLLGGTYSVFVSWSNEDCPTFLGDLVVGDELFLTAEAGPDETICFGESTTITASYTEGGPTATYTWDNGLGDGALQVITPTTTTTYTVTIVDNNGCEGTDNVTITVDDPETPAVAVVNTPCDETTGSITFTYTADPGDMLYSLNGGTTYSTLPRTSATTFLLDNLGIEVLNITLRALVSDCPVSMGDISIVASNIGGTCDDGNPLTLDDTYDADCNCVGTPTVSLSVFALLQGAYDSNGSMLDGLRASGNLSATDPYGQGVSTDPANLGDFGLNSVVDWVEIELRDPADPSVIVGSTAALIRRNGFVASPIDGNLSILIPGVPIGSYYVALNHYNHFRVMTAAPIDLTIPTAIDFTVSTTPIHRFDEGALAPVEDFQALLAGDANKDGTVNAVDKNNFWRNENGQPYIYGTFKGDFNLDGIVNAVDKNDLWRINNSRIELVP